MTSARRDLALALAYAGAVVAARRWQVPIASSPVPVSAQSLVVLAGATAVGPRAATWGALFHGTAAASGLRAAAPGRTGAGYVAGFVVAGPLAATATDGPDRRTFLRGLGGAAAGHAIILASGASWLRATGTATTPAEAWRRGVRPFLPGAVVKSVLVAALATARNRRSVRPAPVRASRPRATP